MKLYKTNKQQQNDLTDGVLISIIIHSFEINAFFMS